MAIFGMNGLSALALDFLLIFAVYGMKPVAPSVKEVAAVSRVVARKGLTGNKEADARLVSDMRSQIAQQLTGKRYAGIKEKDVQAYQAKPWLR